jgi:hypothetical protein
MKKIYFIFLIVFGLFVLNITQATAGCNIVGYGSIPTQETSRTIQAAQELYPWLENGDCFFDGVPTEPAYINNNCYGVSYYGTRSYYYAWVCTDGTWEIGCQIGTARGTIYFRDSGSWDVVCDNPTTTTTTSTVPPVSTTTTSMQTTDINLSSFTALPRAGKVILQWNTEAEIDNAGFNLYRSESDNGEYIKINTLLISAQGSTTQGASYEFVDNNVQNRKTYYYKLEDIDLSGKNTIHGPVSATPRLIYGMKK